MPALQAATTLAWGDAARLQGATALAWGDAARLQSRGSAYTAPGVGSGTVITPGSLAPLRDITAATRYLDTSALTVTDLRDGAVLPVTAVSLDLADGSDLWTLQAAGNGALAETLRAGVQPATVQVTLGADTWRFAVEEISQPITFESTDCTFRGRSLAAAAGAPYQAVTSWIADAPTTPAQIAALSNTFTGVAVDWGVIDWLVPAGSWSASTDPLGVVRQMAAAAGAVVEAHRTELKLLVRPRYATAPNTWGTQRPDVQIAWEAVESANQERNDQPEYNGVLVSGTQSGGLLRARLEGTSGSVQAPMVTDPLLTDTVAQIQRAESLLHSYGGRARETRTLQLHGGVVARGALVRCVEPAETWTGTVRAVSVRATLEQARQTITMERPTSFPAGSTVAPPPVTCVPDSFWDDVLVAMALDGEDGSSTFTDAKGHAFANGPPYGAPLDGARISAAFSKFGGGSLKLNQDIVNGPVGDADFILSGDFTIEYWAYFPNSYVGAQEPQIYFQSDTANQDVQVALRTDNLKLTYGSAQVAVSAGAPYAGRWVHCLAVKSGPTLYVAVDGVVASTAVVNTVTTNNRVFIAWTPAVDLYLGHLRIIKGGARHTTSFTPPPLPFCDHA